MQNKFLRSVVTLAGGTAGAQALSVLSMLVLARYFTPNDFGSLGFVMAFVGIVSIALSCRYELVIFLTKEKGQIRQVYTLCVIVILILSVAIALLVFVLISFAELELGANYSPANLGAVFLGSVSVAWCGVLSVIAVCEENYSGLSKSRLFQASAIAIFSFYAYYLDVENGLVIGWVAAQIATLIYMLVSVPIKMIDLNINNLKGIVGIALKNSRYPRLQLPAHLLNACSMQAPVIIIGYCYGANSAGLFLFAQRVVRLPMSLLGTSIGEVFRKEASSLMLSTGNCAALCGDVIRRCSKLALVPCVLLFLFGEKIFKLILGAHWTDSGLIAELMAPMLFFQFVSSPVVSMYFIRGFQSAEFVMQISLLLLSVLPFYIGVALDLDFKLCVLIFSAAYSILYVINIFAAIRLAKGEV